MSVLDNARDAVFLHVSASSDRHEWGNETGAMTKKKEQHTLTHDDVCDSISYSFFQYSIWQCTLNNTAPHTLIYNIRVKFISCRITVKN